MKLADMPQKSGGPSLENPVKAQPFPYDVHAQNEALRLQRNADSHKLFSKEPPRAAEGVVTPLEKVDANPVPADKLSGDFQERFKEDRADLTRILSDQVWCLRPAVDSRTIQEFGAIESRKAEFEVLRTEVKERLINSGGSDDARPIEKGKLGDDAYVRDRLSNRPEELRLYVDYVTARHQLEASDKSAEPIKARLEDLQNIVDRFCQRKWSAEDKS